MFLNKKQFDALINYIDLMSSQCTGPSIPKVYSELQKLLVEPVQPAVRIDSSGDLHIEPEFPRAKQQSVGTMKEFGDVMKAAIEPENYRVVPRGLLEHCLDTFETWKFLPTSDSGKQLRKNIDTAIAQLKASLAIEKKELKAPPVTVNSDFKQIYKCGFCGASSQNSEAEIPHKWTCPSK
jgi:hypothetical protein